MKKKWIAILVGLTLLGLCAFAAAETVGGTGYWNYGYGFDGGSQNITWELDLSTGVMKIGGSGGWGGYWLGHIPWGENMGDYMLPDGTYAPSHDYRSSIKTVIIGEGITNVASQAFLGCSNLTSVTIPSTVLSIDESAFSGCSSLLTVNLPAKLNKIDEEAFYKCGSMISCDIPAAVTSIGKKAFFETSSLRKIVSYGDIGEQAFKGSGALSAEIYNCGSIGEEAFMECDNLSSVQLCEGIALIPEEAFSKCKVLSKINIPTSVTSIGEKAFYSTAGLTAVTFPNGLTSIGTEAFSSSGLLTVKLPDSVNILGDKAFAYSSNLVSATLSSGLTTLPTSTFSKCQSLLNVTIPNGVQIIGEDAFYECTSLQSIELPQSVLIIKESAFNRCEMLSSVKLPSALNAIGDNAFEKCKALNGIILPDTLLTISASLFTDSGLTWISIPAATTNIRDNAFRGCSEMKNVFYGGDEASRAKMTIGNSNTCLTDAIWHYKEGAPANPNDIWAISYTWADDNSAVTGCAACRYASHQITETVSAEEEITVKPTCETEGEAVYTSGKFDSFLFEKQTKTIVLPAMGHDWGEPEYVWAEDYASVTASRTCNRDSDHCETETVAAAYEIVTPPTYVEEGMGLYTSQAFQNPAFSVQTVAVTIPMLPPPEIGDTFTLSGLKYEIITEDTVSFLGLDRQRLKASVSSLEIPSSVSAFGRTYRVTEIAANAMKKDTALKTVAIGKNVKKIGKNAFASCTKLTTVKGAASVTAIGESAFAGCKVLKAFPVLSKLQTIGASAFKSCIKLTKFTLGKAVKSIGKNAFNGCKTLKNFDVKTTKLTEKNVGAAAFKGIYKKATFKCPKSKLSAYKKLFIKKGAPKTCLFK